MEVVPTLAADFDPQQMYELVNTSAVLAIAQNVARDQLAKTMGKDAVVAALSMDVTVQKLILTEDFTMLSSSAFRQDRPGLVQREELAVLDFDERMRDYEQRWICATCACAMNRDLRVDCAPGPAQRRAHGAAELGRVVCQGVERRSRQAGVLSRGDNDADKTDPDHS